MKKGDVNNFAKLIKKFQALGMHLYEQRYLAQTFATGTLFTGQLLVTASDSRHVNIVNSQACVKEFSNKVAGYRHQGILLKMIPAQDFSCKFSKIFQSTF